MNNNLVPDFSSSLEPLRAIQTHIATILSTYQLEHSKSISQITEPLKAMSQILATANMAPYTEMMESIRRSQLVFANEIAKLNKLYDPLSVTDSLKISNIYSSVVEEIEQDDLFSDFEIEPVDIKEVDKKPLTWEQLLTIITFIITLITFIQAQFPDKDIKEYTEPLNQLIEIQAQQLESLQELNENLSE